MKKSVSILIPAYNEEKLLEVSINNLLKYMRNLKNVESYEIIICDNGSSDFTKKIGKGLSHKNNIKYEYTPVKGFGSAIKLGARVASKDIILFLPADGEVDFDFIKKSVDNFDHNSLFIGVRSLEKSRSASFFRYLLSFSFALIVKFCFSLALTEVGTVKAFENNWLKKFAQKCKKDDFSWQIEILYYALKNNRSIKEVPVKIHSKRNCKESKVSLIKDTVSLGRSCIKCGFLLRTHQFFRLFKF